MECFENTMVGGVVVYLVVSKRARRISTREYVEKKRRCALVKRLFEILNPGVVCQLIPFTLSLKLFQLTELTFNKKGQGCYMNPAC